MSRTIRQKTMSKRELPGGTEHALRFRTEGNSEVEAVIQIPRGAGPFPAVLMLHGFTSRKEVLSGSVGPRLLDHGIASLAIDLPLHGSQAGTADYQATLRNPLQAVALWREAVASGRLSIRYLEARSEVDRSRIGVIGYSLGSHVGAALAAADPAIRALVVAAGGDLPSGTPLAMVARRVADPIKAVRGLQGRPLLMVHGRHDRTVSPEQAERLYAAAGEPKEIHWFDAGHRLPMDALDLVSRWLQEHL